MSFLHALFPPLSPSPAPFTRQKKPSSSGTDQRRVPAQRKIILFNHSKKTEEPPRSMAFGDVATPECPLEHADRFYGMGMIVAKAIGLRARLGFISRRAIAKSVEAHPFVMHAPMFKPH